MCFQAQSFNHCTEGNDQGDDGGIGRDQKPAERRRVMLHPVQEEAAMMRENPAGG